MMNEYRLSVIATETIEVSAKDEEEAKQKAEIIFKLRDRYNCHKYEMEE